MEQTPPIRKASARLYAWIAILVVIFAGGVYAWSTQIAQGTSVLGINDTVTWGTYIVSFFFMIGAGAGLLILATLPQLFGYSGLKALARTGVTLALAAFIAGALFIIADLGSPQNMFNLIADAQWNSFFVWDFVALVLSFVLALVYLFMTRRTLESAGSKIVGGLTSLAAITLVSVEALILSSTVAHSTWANGFMPVSFIVYGLAEGAALLVIVGALTSRFTSGFGAEGLSALGKVLAALILIGLVLTIGDQMAAQYYNQTQTVQTSSLLLTGSYAWLFWSQIIAGMLIPFFIFAFPRARISRTPAVVASILVLAGAFMEKFSTVVVTQLNPLILNPTTYLTAAPSYATTWVEWTLTMGLFALAALLYTVGTRVLKITVA